MKECLKDQNKESYKYVFIFQEGPHSIINEDEFFDAVDATLDKLEKEEEKVRVGYVPISVTSVI